MFKRLLLLIGLGLLGPWNAWAQWSPTGAPKATARADHYVSPQTSARLIAHAPQGLAIGAPLWLGVEITHQANWHTYWQNSGESGIPTDIQWQLPEHWQAGTLQWPTPKKFTLGPLGNYGYDGSVLLAAPVRINQLPQGGDIQVRASVDWLACRTECIPEHADLTLKLSPGQIINEDAFVFERHQQRLPMDHGLDAHMRIDGSELLLQANGVPEPWRGASLEAFPEVANLIVPGAAWTQQWQGDQWQARLPLNPDRELSPEHVHWVLAKADAAHGENTPAGLRLQATMQGPWPEVTPARVPPALQAALAQQPSGTTRTTNTPTTYWLSLGLALLGGMLLNLMPCVFPVLAIKILAFAQNDDVRVHRASGLAYTAGVVASFVALAALLLGLRSAGEAVGWGFQLQHPATVAILAVLFTLIALNLFGWFEVTHLLPGRWAGLRLRHPVADAAWSGVLSTAVASPCTAPFMGAALGAAITLPTAQALGLFAAVGLGMALPYLLISWFPVLSRLLPGPGAWMQTFRELMAFPMLATVVWLLWVLGQQSGIHGAAALLLMLVGLAFGFWMLKRAAGHRLLSAVAYLVIATSAISLWPLATQTRQAQINVTASADGWQAWSPERERAAISAQQRVFVDFTAAWCVTCQVNELGAMRDPAVLEAFAQGGWVRLRADWTQHDPAITQALNALQRNGVPTYAVYHPGQAVVVLSELLSASQLLKALQAR